MKAKGLAVVIIGWLALSTLALPNINIVPYIPIYIAAPTITDRDLALLIRDVSLQGGVVYLTVDQRKGLAPNAYTAHLSSLPNVRVRLVPNLREEFIIYKKTAYRKTKDGYQPYNYVSAARRFNAYWKLGTDWVYIPKPPPGYVIYRDDPLLKLSQTTLDYLVQGAKESLKESRRAQ